MYQHPVILEAMARDRAAQVRRDAQGSAVRGSGARGPVAETATNRLGWLLVGLGLRLALPRRSKNRSLQRRRPLSL
jgi:hypothetical protein